jgi:purine-binding chemotaxis protein CheW
MKKPATQPEPEESYGGGSTRTLVFRVGGEQFGLPLVSVVEVFESPARPTPVPGAPEWVAGVINHHGQVVPVIHLHAFLMVASAPGPERSGSGQVILADLPEGRFGFVVDQIESIEEIRTEGAEFQGKKRSWHRGNLLELVEPKRLMGDINRRLSSSEVEA